MTAKAQVTNQQISWTLPKLKAFAPQKISRKGKETHKIVGTSLVFQWLQFHASTAGGMGSIPGQGTEIPHATWCNQKLKELVKIFKPNIYI